MPRLTCWSGDCRELATWSVRHLQPTDPNARPGLFQRMISMTPNCCCLQNFAANVRTLTCNFKSGRVWFVNVPPVPCGKPLRTCC